MQPQPESRSSALARWLALNRTVGVVLLAVLLFGLGEELWGPFLPVYLKDTSKKEAESTGLITGAVLGLVGLYACLRNLFEGGCYLAGGQLTARLGDRGSLLLFGGLTLLGYTLFLCSQGPALAIVAALLILGWEPLATPVTFTTVGSTVDPTKRGMAFAIQSIQKRLPKVLGPLIAGFVLGWAQRYTGDERAGSVLGMHLLVGGALALGVASIAFQLRYMPHRDPPPPGPSAREIFRTMHPTLRRLLLAEVFTRTCDWMTREFVVLYLLLEWGVSKEAAGALIALQHLTALLTYLPIGGMTQSLGVRPFVGVSFVFFALCPLALLLVPSPGWLWAAFVVYGLREIGEPARKAMITSLFPPDVRARGVGLYWGLRSFAMAPASLLGAALWFWWGLRVLLLSAFAVGAVGAAVYYFLAAGGGKKGA
jgi:MFS family permease